MKRLLSENDFPFKKLDGTPIIKRSSPCNEIGMLLKLIPQLNDSFDVKKKVGEGTFSSVYLAKIKGSGPKNKCVALKHLIPTIQPNKILLELQCLQKFGGRCNVMGLLSTVRSGNHAVIVMPFFPNYKFVDFFKEMDLAEVKLYIKNLLEAVAFIHSGGIIHRDIKPSNFLYNRKLKRFALVDFGLAQKVATTCPPMRHKNRPSKRIDHEELIHATPTPNADETASDKAFVKLSPTTLGGKCLQNSHVQLTISGNENSTSDNSRQKCGCHKNPQVCRSCLIKSTQVAFRAGTPGYRPPEVLLKHPHQTIAIDVWAAGIIFLSLVTGRYPFFHASDDVSALAEMMTIFGTEPIKNCALELGKIITCSPPVQGINLRQICENLRHNTSLLNNAKEEETEQMYDLLCKMLDVNFNNRITAYDALQHVFFKTESAN